MPIPWETTVPSFYILVRFTDDFLAQEFTNALHIFTAWINLDFGIEACFYNAMVAVCVPSIYYKPLTTVH